MKNIIMMDGWKLEDYYEKGWGLGIWVVSQVINHQLFCNQNVIG